MPILRPHADHTPRDIPRTSHLYRTNWPARGPRGFVQFWASGEQSSPKCEIIIRSWTPMNRRAKFDAVSFILGREIRNCKTHTPMHTHKQTRKQAVTDISTPCLSACVDNNRLLFVAEMKSFENRKTKQRKRLKT